MIVHKDVIKDIEKLPAGPQIGAFFDFDGTLIAGFSATVFLKEQIRRGDLSPYQLVELVLQKRAAFRLVFAALIPIKHFVLCEVILPVTGVFQ